MAKAEEFTPEMAADRRWYIQQNAVALINLAEDKIRRQAEQITRLENSRREMRRLIRHLSEQCQRLNETLRLQ